MTSPDVIIAGGGIIGASIAWRLAQQRVLVTLFDVGQVGGEASTAGAGMLAPGGEIAARSPLGDLCLESLQLYPQFIADLEAASGEQIDFRITGATDFAATEAEWTALHFRAEAQRNLGIHSEPVPLPSRLTHFTGALHFPADAIVDPRGVMRALRTACDRAGVKMREGVPVKSIQSRAGRVDVTTDRRVISSEAAIIAAGAWSSSIATIPPSVPQSEPVRGHLVSFRMPPGRIPGIYRHGHTYLLQRATGELIAGTSQERVGFDRTLNPATVADICRRAAQLIPELEGREPDRAWIGFRPGLIGADEGPLLDRLPDTNIWRAYGHYRNGILLAPITADRIAAGILQSLSAAK